jgi:hypothetical protein
MLAQVRSFASVIAESPQNRPGWHGQAAGDARQTDRPVNRLPVRLDQ